MKKAATIVSWVEFGVTALIVLISFAINEIDYALVWIIYVIVLAIQAVILIWREYDVNHGKNIACGVCTIIFVSILGGIFTVCIPENQLNPSVKEEQNKQSGDQSADLQEKHTEQQAIDLLIKYKKLLDDGIISQEEFNDKKQELLK